MASAHRATIPHLPALDGLRGVAVIGVVLFHADALLRGGYLGVDLFFVLSGYLITSIILSELDATGTLDLKAFWVRRARRLFPALLSIMPAIALYARFVAGADELAGLRNDALATLAYVANWRAIFSEKSYWDLFIAPSPLEHTWSLAIEEQFYVAWPLIVTLVFGVLRKGRKTLLGVTLALLLGSMLLMLLLYDMDRTSRVYFGTDTRAASILAGVVLSILLPAKTEMSMRTARVLDGFGAFTIVVLGVAWVKLDGQSTFVYHGGFWLNEALALVLIACAVAGKKSLVARLFSVRPLAYMGTISYGVYLWHWPIDCLLTANRTHIEGLKLQLVRMSLTLVIAMLSYRFFERPIRMKGLPFGKPIWVVPAAFAASALSVVAGTRARPIPPAPVAAHDPPPQGHSFHPPFPSAYAADVETLLPASELPAGTPRVLVVGDSVAQKLGVSLRHRQDERRMWVAHRGVGDCSIVQNLKVDRQGHPATAVKNPGCASRWVLDTAELKPDLTLIVLGGGYYAQMMVEGKPEHACEAGWHATYRARLVELIDGMGTNAGQVVITLVPYPMDRWRYEGVVEWVECFNGILKEVADEKQLPTLDLMGHVCPTQDCIRAIDGVAQRPDGLHPDGTGAEEMSRWTLAQLLTQLPSRAPDGGH